MRHGQVASCRGVDGKAPVGEAYPAVLDCLHRRPRPQGHVIALQPGLENPTGGVAQPVRLGTVFHAHQRNGQASAGQ